MFGAATIFETVGTPEPLQNALAPTGTGQSRACSS